MQKLIGAILLLVIGGCTTIHFRSNNSIPVGFDGNPKHQKQVSIVGHRNFYFWGLNPDETVVYVDEEVRKAGYDGMSKVIIYENKDPQDILISCLTFGLYLPRAYTITGFTSGVMLPEDEPVPAPAPAPQK